MLVKQSLWEETDSILEGADYSVDASGLANVVLESMLGFQRDGLLPYGEIPFQTLSELPVEEAMLSDMGQTSLEPFGFFGRGC